MTAYGNIRYNSNGYWEVSDNNKAWYQIAAKDHTHLSVDITDASSVYAPDTLVKRDTNGSASFNDVFASTSTLAGDYLIIGPQSSISIVDNELYNHTNLSIRGVDSNFKITVQDNTGDGRVNFLWNADKSLEGTYLSGGDAAAKLAITDAEYGSFLTFSSATSGHQGAPIYWTQIFGSDADKNFVIGPEGNEGTVITPEGKATFASNVQALSFDTKSALKYKTNVKKLEESALDLINRMGVYEYTYKNDPNNSKRIGIIADYVDDVRISGENHDKSDIVNTVGVLIKGIQELYKLIDAPDKET